MSQPIDIPGNPSKRPRPEHSQCSFAPEEGPHFGFIEVFERGDIRWMVSTGCNGYVEVSQQSRLPSLAFVVQKDRISRDITLEIISQPLRRSIQVAILSHFETQTAPKIDLDVILMNYGALKSYLRHLEGCFPYDEVTAEMRLLVSDLLPERALYESIGLESFQKRGVLCPSLVQDLHHTSICMGLDDIEDYFALGMVPDHVNERYLEGFNTKFENLARSGDHLSLQDLCEPVVRSGEIEFQYNPELLLELLDSGHLEAYLYVLELVQRTRPGLTDAWDPNFTDITFEAMHVAIRLGHLEVVRSFVNGNNCFEGRLYDDTRLVNGHVFTPLFAAVFWGQTAVVRLLLRSGPIYLPGYHQAAAFALANDMQEIIQVFLEHESAASPVSLLGSYPPSWAASRPSSVSASGRPTIQTHPASAQGFSIIASGLSSLAPSASSTDLSVNASRDGMPPESSGPSVHSCFPSIPHSDCEPWMLLSEQCPRTSDKQENSKHSAKEARSHKARREQSQKLVLRLEHNLQKISGLCKNSPPQDFADLSGSTFSSPEQVWISGIQAFRAIVENKTPSDLAEVLQSLLLADALIFQFSNRSQSLHTQFINDLGRWRSILDDYDQPRFDQVISVVWEYPDGTSFPSRQGHTDELYYFQELIQNLVQAEGIHRPTSRKERALGSRLRSLQARREFDKTMSDVEYSTLSPADASFRSIGSVLNRLTMNDEGLGNEFNLEDFIHVDKLQEECQFPEGSRVREFLHNIGVSWEPISSVVVLLLASVAFSIVLITVLAFHGHQHEDLLTVFDVHSCDYGRSCAIVENLVDLGPHKPLHSSPRTEKLQKYHITAMKAAILRDDSEALPGHSFPSATSTLPDSMDSPNGSSFLSTSPEAIRTADRLSCTKCAKAFSSVSNRNKHMREGCSYREKKGYKCRNSSCTKVLTTSWYRKTHEQTRCRFR